MSNEEVEVEVDLSEFQEDAEREALESVDHDETEYSEVEMQAMEHGWTPEGVEGKRNLTAEEFLDRQPLYDDLKAQKKQIKQLREGVEALKQHNATIAERERAKVMAELKQAKKEALAQENYDAVVEIDDQIAEHKARDFEEPQANNAAFEAFVEENPWYNQDAEMKQFADEVGTGHFQNNPHKSVTEVYEYVESRVKKAFPEKFGNPNRGKPSPVEGAVKGRSSAPKSKYSAKDLPESDRQIMRTIVRTGAMTEQEYLKQYFD